MEEKIELLYFHLIENIILYTPRIVSSIGVFVTGLWLINYVTKLFKNSMKRRGFDASLQPFLSSLASGSLKVILLISVAGMIGIQTTSFVAVIGAAGLAVGLALQGSLANFAGGVLTLVFKPFIVGDIIDAQGQFGEVLEIQIFNTILLTTDKKTVILPNGALSNGTIVNYSKYGKLCLEIPLEFSHNTDIKFVRNLLIETCNQNKMVLKAPQANMEVSGSKGGINVLIKAYVEPKNSWIASADLNEEFFIALYQAGIKEPIPEFALTHK